MDPEKQHEEPIDFALLTALEVERKAVCLCFGLTEAHRIKIGSRVYWRGSLRFDDGARYELVVAQSPDMANIDMALLTNDTLHDWRPGAVILVGIAGAARSEVACGDVVVGSDVYYYERSKLTAEGAKHEPKIIAADATLWSNVSALPDWDGRVPLERPEAAAAVPRVHKGVIASGEKVIADQTIRDQIVAGHRKILAIEMEGYGCGRAVWQSAQQVRLLVIRGISDAANASKNDDWHAYAAATAAGFTKHFLADRPLPPRTTSSIVDHTARIVATSAGLDWMPYLRSVLQHYEREERFSSFIRLRKYDSKGGTKDRPIKSGLHELDAFVDQWIADLAARHLAVLGGYGSGKTWYCHWLAHRLAKAYTRSSPGAPVPVLIPLRSLIEAPDVSAVLELFWDHMGRGDFTLFKQAVFQGDVILILDGFDEMSIDFRNQVSADNFARLKRFFTGRSKMILTSRDTYFDTAVEERTRLTSHDLKPLETGLLSSNPDQPMRIVHLDGFDASDIRKYFTLRFGSNAEQVHRRLMASYDLPDLATRPILANIIASTLNHLDDATVTAAGLYDRYVHLWLDRESWRIPDTSMVLRFTQDLAMHMQSEEVLVLSSDVFNSRLAEHFKLDAAQLEDTSRRIKNCSFLTRDAAGAWSFIHKSFMEFFCACRCYEDFVTGAIDFTSSFPLSESQISILYKTLNIILPTARLAQARYALASGPSEVRNFFSDMLITAGRVNEFGRFLIRSRVTVWGFKFFERNNRLHALVEPSILERLESDFDWDYYLQNEGFNRVFKPNSPNRLQYLNEP